MMGRYSMRDNILKKASERNKAEEKYYFYTKEEIEVLSKEELEKRMKGFLKEKHFQLLQEAKKESHSKPTYSKLEGSLGAREEEFVVLQTAQSIERYAFPELVGVMPLVLELSCLSASAYTGAFGKSRRHSYEKEFNAIDSNTYALNLADGRFFLFEKESDETFKDLGSLGVRVADCSFGFKEACFKLYYPTGIVEHYKNEQLVSIEDKHSNNIQLEYEENNKLRTIKNSSGSSFRFYYANGVVVKLQDHSGRTWNFAYDEENYLTKTALEKQIEQSYEYENSFHYLSSIKNALGHEQVSLEYNKDGELESYTQGEEVVNYIWHTKSQIEKVNEAEERTIYGLDNYGLISHISYPDGTSTNALWDEKNLEEIRNTRGGNQELKTFDEKGRVLSVVLNENEEQYYAYDENNLQPLSFKSSEETLSYDYDEKYNLISINHEDGTSIKYAYTNRGQIEQVVDAKKNVSSYVYNEQGEISEVVDALGNKECYEYDALGRVTQHTSANNLKKTFSYNPRDQLLSSSNALGESMEFKYNKTGQLRSIKDPAFRITSYVYDQYNRVVEKHNPNLFNHKTLKEIEQIEYYSYNSNNSLAKIQRVDETSLSFEYDLNQNITKVIATSKEGESQEQSYLYDALSNLEEARTKEHHTEILYSKKAKPLIQVQDGIDVHKNYEGASQERVSSISFLNESTHYAYDEFHNLKSLTYNQKDINFTYDKNKVLTQRAYPNNKKESLSYDENYNLLSIGDDNESTAYKYNENAELIERFNEHVNEEPLTYEYNQRGELSQAGEQSYTYSKAGNQIGNEQAYNNLNHLLEDSEYKYRYDKRGNLAFKTHKETQTQTLYTFNLFDQLVKVEKKDKEQNVLEALTYVYDALNRRVSKICTSTKFSERKHEHHYLYDEHNIVAILDHNKELLASIVHDKNIDTPLSITTHQNEARELTKAEAYHYDEFDEETKAFINKKRKQQTYYYHRDHQGSITKLTDEQGIIVERFVYDAYGKIVEHMQGRDTFNPYCYTGREFDAYGLYDLYYYRAMYYHPSTGRFISSDPIEFLAGDFNFFRYVGGSPVNFRDPSGLCPPCVVILVRIVVVVVVKIAKEVIEDKIEEVFEDATGIEKPSKKKKKKPAEKKETESKGGEKVTKEEKEQRKKCAENHRKQKSAERATSGVMSQKPGKIRRNLNNNDPDTPLTVTCDELKKGLPLYEEVYKWRKINHDNVKSNKCKGDDRDPTNQNHKKQVSDANAVLETIKDAMEKLDCT
jgi:RHS repeat-associated protein